MNIETDDKCKRFKWTRDLQLCSSKLNFWTMNNFLIRVMLLFWFFDIFFIIFHYFALRYVFQPFFIDHTSKRTTFIDPRLPTEAPVLHASVLNYSSNSSSASVPPRPRHPSANESEVSNRDVTSRQQTSEPVPIGEATECEYGDRTKDLWIIGQGDI